MKKFLTFLFILLLSSNAFAATTYYVRVLGGTLYNAGSNPTGQCAGTTNANYPGSGVNQACAANSPSWIMGTNGNSGAWSGGDTMIIDDASSAQYKIGFGMPNTVSGNCNLFSPYACTLNAIPSGPDVSHPTRILGSSYASGCATKPQLYGVESVTQILNGGGNSHIDVECIEITDHSNCGLRVGSPVCTENYNGSANGNYGRNGFYSHGGADFTFKNVDIHGMSNRNFLMGGINGITFDHVNMDGGYQANWDGDVGESGSESSMSGTILMKSVKNRFAGCSEAYPRSSSFATADYTNCTDQNDNPPGYGDGVGMYNTGGNWVIKDSEFSHNTQDGLDLLYHLSGDVQITRTLFEGNDGNQLKITAQNAEVDNSVFVSNCTYHTATSKVKNTSTWTNCRANGGTVAITPLLGSVFKFYGNTAYTTSNFIEATDRYGTCNGTETYTFSNNLNVGNGSATLYYNGLGGSCSTAYNNRSTDHSLTYQFASSCPSGTGNTCSTNPVWVGSISTTADSNLANVYIQTSSPAKGTGTNVPSYFDTQNDINNMSRASSFDMGGIEYNSTLQCTAASAACIASSDCCSPNTCSSFFCTGSCTSNGGGCSVGGSCCSGTCSASICCVANASSCSVNSDCCSGNCCSGTCSASTCPANPSNFSCSRTGNVTVSGNVDFH